MNEQAKRRDDGTRSDSADDEAVAGEHLDSEPGVGETESPPAEAVADGAPEQQSDLDHTGLDGEAVAEESELQQAEAKAAENWDHYLRTAAELENVRKRATRDVENARRFALERFGKELLAVRDSLEMGLAAEKASVESLREGSDATLKLLGSTMQQFGIEEVDPAGEPFDPELHEAISVQPSDDVEPGSVIAVVQKGYTLNGRLLRPAMVVVSPD